MKSTDVFQETVKSRVEIGFTNLEKKWNSAEAIYTSEGNLEILGHPVMQPWETHYMGMLAEIATKNGGRILEVGFGLGISASKIQTYDIDSHVILEANGNIFSQAIEFSNNSTYKTTLIYGFWQDCIKYLESSSFDGILFDTYPLTENEIHSNHFPFFVEAYRILKKGGVFTYYSDEPFELSDHHILALQEAGFNDINYSICEVNPPVDCEYWKHKSIVAPIIKK